MPSNVSCRRSLCGAALAVLLAVPGTASAVTPTRIDQVIDQTFQSATWSARCGVPVVISEQATVHVTLFADQAGRTIRELDVAPGFRTTVSSPLSLGGTGRSFTSVSATAATFRYPDGVFIGAPATATFTGLQAFAAPGYPTAGRDTLVGEVAALSPEGIPLVDLTDFVTSVGGRSFSFTAARCGFLLGT